VEPAVEVAFRLLPSERVLWEGRPTPGTPRPPLYLWLPLFLGALALISACFAALLWLAEMPGALRSSGVATYLGLLAAAVRLAPRFLLDPCRFAITDRRVLWKRGHLRRSMDRHAVSFARVRWSTKEVGSLDLVRAVPFGPLARRQKLTLHGIEAPDRVLAVLRGVEVGDHLGDPDVPLVDRLDPGEEVRWGGGPQGMLVGWRDLATVGGGVLVLVFGLRYFAQAARILLELTDGGIAVGSPAWSLLFAAMAMTVLVIVAVGLGLVWHGWVRARAMGRETEYLVTDRRLLIRRGPVELSLDRRQIVDVAETPSWLGGGKNFYAILDAPEARALADSGALGPLAPSRDAMLPVLFEVRDGLDLRERLLGRPSTHP
jgi:membrane protein YdbS with pleckstrin-like domain